jgi:hypothetical protein
MPCHGSRTAIRATSRLASSWAALTAGTEQIALAYASIADASDDD